MAVTFVLLCEENKRFSSHLWPEELQGLALCQMAQISTIQRYLGFGPIPKAHKALPK